MLQNSIVTELAQHWITECVDFSQRPIEIKVIIDLKLENYLIIIDEAHVSIDGLANVVNFYLVKLFSGQYAN